MFMFINTHVIPSNSDFWSVNKIDLKLFKSWLAVKGLKQFCREKAKDSIYLLYK